MSLQLAYSDLRLYLATLAVPRASRRANPLIHRDPRSRVHATTQGNPREDGSSRHQLRDYLYLTAHSVACRLSSSQKLVAEPYYSLKKLWLARVSLEFASQSEDVHVHGARRRRTAIPPHFLQKLPSR